MPTARDSQVLEKLAELEASKDRLPPAPLAFYRRLLSIQYEARSRISTPSPHLDGKTISNRTASGVPLLGFDDLLIDWSLGWDTFEKVAALLESYPEAFGGLPEATGLISSPGLFRAAARDWFEGKPLAPGDGAVPEFILGASLKPFLASHVETLLERVDQEQWRRGYCPVCGGSPDFACLKETGARWLLCSRCDTPWLFQRLECPSCGNQEQNALAYFTDDSGLYRLYVCERCRHYLKAIDLRCSGREFLLPLERFLTLELDFQAQGDGYSPTSNQYRVKK